MVEVALRLEVLQARAQPLMEAWQMVKGTMMRGRTDKMVQQGTAAMEAARTTVAMAQLTA